MRKVVWIFYLFLAVSIMGLAGCSETASKEAEAEDPKEKDEEKKEKAKKKKEEEKPTIVEVVDPDTEEVLITFEPEKMGYKENKEGYQQEIANWAKEIARGNETTEGYDRIMVLDRIGENGEIVKGLPQVILEEAELVEKIMEASDKAGKVKVVLPIYTTESQYDSEEVPSLNEVVVSSYTTYYNNGVAGRSKNIELSAAAINNVILGVEDQFSFNTVVGPSDAEHGYQPAEEAVNGKLVMGIGGGICQTSSTLFNAVDSLSVDYIEKHNHSVNVGYVPKGRDATVSYGGVDFRFKNTTGVPLLLKAHTNNGMLTVEVRTSQGNYEKIKNN